MIDRNGSLTFASAVFNKTPVLRISCSGSDLLEGGVLIRRLPGFDSSEKGETGSVKPRRERIRADSMCVHALRNSWTSLSILVETAESHPVIHGKERLTKK